MFRTSPTRPREGLLTVVMAATLALAVLGAWWLSQGRTGPATLGSELLRDLRKEGLAGYMPSQPRQAWYLLQGPKGTPVGWRVDFIAPADGGYSGRTLEALSLPQLQKIDSSVWSIQQDASAGNYQATARATGENAVVTQIALRGPKIAVSRELHSLPPVRAEGEDDTPTNYIPEGLEPVVLRLVCRQERKATFRMIFDPESVDRNGQLHFVRATMTPQDGNVVHCTYYSLGGASRNTYYLDADGQILRIERSNGITEQRVDRAEVIRHFPDAAKADETDASLGEGI